MIIFGASGDLTKRKLIPGLYNLACEGYSISNLTHIGEHFAATRR